MDVERIVNGSYGELWENGEHQQNVNAVTAEVTIDKADVRLSGDRWLHKKVIGLSGTGTITGFKVTSAMIQRHAWAQGARGVPTKTELITKLDDPEAYGAERIRLKNVSFDKIILANFKPNELVTEEIPFTFTGYELLDPIEEA
ncbi:Phage tail tube protein [Desulfotomaculum arcticum]|uniref:Phage tail tube protein n=1 Tax=Desulfotruncus arcticus DSM 17038 TaxID=1121424 RepID=A0A1I2Y8B2_9FIRM|nr:phage tail tube protein [Desulfotruncus arcticus]SFH21186.1 Phage tail tube protein [Desulfotomaculum arcticum] [Desulfotruncus arcticus DSM 17038]